jgi:CHAD domain-containing protein
MAEKIRWDSGQTALENARRKLPPLIAAYFAAGRVVATQPVEPRNMHRFRLEGKRLRYTMELFKPVYGTGFDHYLELLRGAQTRLGDLNDCTAAKALLEQLPGSPEEKKTAFQFLEGRTATKYTDFQQYWREEVDGMERRWTRYVDHPRSRKK